MLAKSDIITAITKLNPGANPGFLAEFSRADLKAYYQRLTDCAPENVHDNQYYLPFDLVGPLTPREDPYPAALADAK